MPVDVVMDAVRRWVRVRMTGRLTLEEVLNLIGTARADVEHQMWPMLVDGRSATTDATEQDIERVVSAVQEAVRLHGMRGHVAVVADDDIFYARLLLYETRCAQIGVTVIRVFRQITDAERWLELLSSTRHF